MYIYYADIRKLDSELYEKGCNMVNLARKSKLERFVKYEDKCRSLLAGLLLNYAAAAYENGSGSRCDADAEFRRFGSRCDADAEFRRFGSRCDADAEFRRFGSSHDDFGECRLVEVSPLELIQNYSDKYDYEIIYLADKKPVFKEKNIFFNISHSGDYAVCVAGGVCMGIDIEQIRDINLKIAESYFSENEYQWVGDDKERFFRIWTLKEAYGKAVGDGIVKTIRKTEFECEATGKTCLRTEGKKTDCLIFEESIENYRIALILIV